MNDSTAPLRHLAAQLQDRLITGLGALEFKEKPGTLELFVERGVARAVCTAQPDRASDEVVRIVQPVLEVAPRASEAIVVDRAGHTRPHYRPLLIHALLLTAKALGTSACNSALSAWCEDLASRLSRWDATARDVPASKGSAAAEMAWTALALREGSVLLGRPEWAAMAGPIFSQLVASQTRSGAFLTASASDNPETHWYHELVVLHAVANFAVVARDEAARGAVFRATAFHQDETQPDHATNQPWGLFAFAWNPATRPMAEGMLHALTVHGAVEGGRGALPPVTLMLLADALYCVRRLLLWEEES